MLLIFFFRGLVACLVAWFSLERERERDNQKKEKLIGYVMILRYLEIDKFEK